MDDIGKERLIESLAALCLRHRVERSVHVDAHQEREQQHDYEQPEKNHREELVRHRGDRAFMGTDGGRRENIVRVRIWFVECDPACVLRHTRKMRQSNGLLFPVILHRGITTTLGAVLLASTS